MSAAHSARLKMEIDRHNQWFVYLWVSIGKSVYLVRFKVDTGCNALVLSHQTLKKLGFNPTEADLSKLPSAVGTVVGGSKIPFRKLGAVSLYEDKTKTKL